MAKQKNDAVEEVKVKLPAWREQLNLAQTKMLSIVDEQIAKRELGFAYQILLENTYLQGCEPASIYNAVINIARTSVTLNPVMKLAYLVPRKTKGVLKCVLDFSYIGLLKMLKDHGCVKDIRAYIVYEDEVAAKRFKIEDFKVVHDPIIAKSEAEQNKRIVYGAYSKVLLPDDTIIFTEILPLWEIEKIRNTSESYKSEKSRKYSPWVTWESEMIKKTKLKRDFKTLISGNPSKELQAALELEQNNSEDFKKASSSMMETFSEAANTEKVEDVTHTEVKEEKPVVKTEEKKQSDGKLAL